MFISSVGVRVGRGVEVGVGVCVGVVVEVGVGVGCNTIANFAMNASTSPPLVVYKAPCVVGKLEDPVSLIT